MSLDNHVHYHQCGALHIGTVDWKKRREVEDKILAGKLPDSTPYCESGMLYEGPDLAIGCGHVWKHDDSIGKSSKATRAHVCPACGEPHNTLRLYGLDLEKLGVALDKVQEFPRAA